MKISRYTQAKKIKNNENCVVSVNAIEDELIDIVTIKISGRYPEKQRATNVNSKEMVHVLDGSGILSVNDN